VVTVLAQMRGVIDAEPSDVLLRSDFRDVGSASQVTRGLRYERG